MQRCQKFDEATWDYNSPPQEPVFSADESEECRKEISEFYETATSTYERSVKNDAKLNASYEAILKRQKDYGISLSNNEKFEAWTISDWEQSFNY